MAGKKGEKRTDDYGAQKDNQQNRDTVSSMVQKMLKPTGKNPYYKGEMAINNLDDLDDRLESFDTTEAPYDGGSNQDEAVRFQEDNPRKTRRADKAVLISNQGIESTRAR
jgi:hypothetical protein